ELAIAGDGGGEPERIEGPPPATVATSVDFSPAGDRVAVLEDGTAGVWDRPSRRWRELGRYPGARYLSYVGGDRLLLRATHGVIVIDGRTGETRCALETPERISASIDAPDGKSVAFAVEHPDDDSELRSLDLASCSARRLFVAPKAILVHTLLFS